MKKIIALLLALTLVFSCGLLMTSCGDSTDEPCTEHTDKDENGICDVCDEPLIKPEETPDPVNVTFTIKDQEGAVVPNVEITFTPRGAIDEEEAIAIVGDENGTLTASLIPGTYFLSADYDSSVGYYFLATTEIKVEKTTASLEILMENTTPNGTEGRPFPLSSVEGNELVIPAGATQYFVVYRAVNLIADITASGVTVTYGGTDYTPDADNKISFSFLGTDTNSVETVVITNTSGVDETVLVEITSVPGTLGNPFEITELGGEISKNVAAKSTVYFSYVATEAGTITLTVTSDATSAAMQNGSIQVSTTGEGSDVISIDVAAGDEVIIDASTSVSEDAVVTFTLVYSAE